MPSTELTFTNEVGLHARPAALFAKAAKEFQCDLSLAKGDEKANAKSLLSVLKLDVRQGDRVTLTADGDDAERAIDELSKLAAEF